MKTEPIISLENPPSGAIPATPQQLAALGITPAEIEAGEKRFDSTDSGAPWHVTRSLRAIVQTAEFNPENHAKRWADFYPMRTMTNPRSAGYDMEGFVSLRGKKSSCFTTSQLFELPDGKLVDVAVIFSRSKIRTTATATATA